MKPAIALVALVAALTLAACERQDQRTAPPPPAVQQALLQVRPNSPQAPIADELIANERNAWATFAARDVEGNGRLLAPDYRDVQPDGTVLDRAGHLAFVPEANMESYELDRFNVFLMGPDAALVTYRAQSRDRGASEPYEAAVTSGWARREGRWMNVFYRETPTMPVGPEQEPEAEQQADAG